MIKSLCVIRFHIVKYRFHNIMVVSRKSKVFAGRWLVIGILFICAWSLKAVCLWTIKSFVIFVKYWLKFLLLGFAPWWFFPFHWEQWSRPAHAFWYASTAAKTSRTPLGFPRANCITDQNDVWWIYVAKHQHSSFETCKPPNRPSILSY